MDPNICLQGRLAPKSYPKRFLAEGRIHIPRVQTWLPLSSPPGHIPSQFVELKLRAPAVATHPGPADHAWRRPGNGGGL